MILIFTAGSIQLNQDLSDVTDVIGFDVDVTVGDHRNNGTTKIMSITIIGSFFYLLVFNIVKCS